MKEDFTILITRIIHANLPYFGDDFKKLVTKHIPHKYSAIMSKKSEVVSVFAWLLYLDFKDAVREGDGERVLRIWKYFFVNMEGDWTQELCM